MDISTITDINTLKVMKSDQYDLLELHQTGINNGRANIEKLNTRIAELQNVELPKGHPAHGEHATAAAAGSESAPTDDGVDTTSTTTEAV